MVVAPSQFSVAGFDFVLPDQHGNLIHLAEYQRDRRAVVVFYRGHWCPYCRRYLAKLQAHYSKITDRDAVLVTISPEPIETSRRLASDLQLQFPLLSDTSGQVIDRYQTRNGFTTARSLLPHPSVFVIDPDHSISFRSIDRNYKKRTTMRKILQSLDGRA